MSRLIDNGDGTVTDIQTGLDWQKAVSRADWFAASKMVAPNGWRCPTKYELFGLQEAYAAQPHGLPDSPAEFFWSSSEYDDGRAWLVHFGNGYVSYGNRSGNYAVRLVRASPQASFRF